MEKKPRSRRRWQWRACVGVSLLIAAVCCGLPTALVWWGLERAFGVRHELGWIDSERKKLPPWEPPPVPNPNAFTTYRSAIALLPTTSDPEVLMDWLSAVGEGDAQEAAALLPDVRLYLAQCGPAFAAMHEATGRDYVIPEDVESLSRFADHTGHRRLARIAATAARLAWEDGDYRTALSRIEDVYALGIGLPRGGDVIDLLVGAAVMAIAERQSAEILLSGRVTPEVLRAHAARVRDLRSNVWPYWRTVWKSATHTLSVFDTTFRRGVSPADLRAQFESEAAAVRVEDRVRGHFMTADLWKTREWVEDRYARFVEELQKPVSESRFHELADRTEADAKARHDALAEELRPWYVASARDKWAQMVVYLAADETIACLEAYKKERGSYPASLDQLVPDYMPDVPEDPWTAKPLIYRLTPERYTLYATGPNGVDDGGVTEGRGLIEPDLVIVPIPPPRQATPPPQTGP